MSEYLAWMTFALGAGHIVYGLVKFRAPLAAAVRNRIFDQFEKQELRRTAFWFLAFGPLLMLAGQLCIHAVSIGDVATVRVISGYLLAISMAGFLAFPKSPFVLALPTSALLFAQGYGWLS